MYRLTIYARNASHFLFLGMFLWGWGLLGEKGGRVPVSTVVYLGTKELWLTVAVEEEPSVIG